MLILHILILAVLVVIAFQDLQSRSVQWIWFPALALMFFFNRYQQGDDAWRVCSDALLNIALLAIQLLLLSVYVSWRQKLWINLAKGWLGWGDILFLGALCLAFPTGIFVLFYIGSLLLVAVGWLVYLQGNKKAVQRDVPLAGLQALLLAAVLVYIWLSGYAVTGNGSLTWMKLY